MNKILQSVTKNLGPVSGYKSNLIAQAQAYLCGGNKHPHFSVTGSIGNEAGGCLHDEILAKWPKIKPIIDLHLSNADDGEPMHAKENGWYWMTGCLDYATEKCRPEQSPLECLRILSNHLRISDTNCLSLVRIIQGKKFTETPKEYFFKFCDGLKPMWQKQCDDGLELIKRLSK